MHDNGDSSPRILVLRLSSLGDIILTAPVYRNLREKWPGCHIAVLTKPQYASALSGHPAISEVIAFKSLFSAIQEIKKRKFTHLIDLHSNLRTLIISALSGIPLKTRYKKDAFARRVFVNFKLPRPALQRHTLDRYLETLSGFDVPLKHRSPELSDWDTAAGNDRPATPKPAANICVLQTAFLGDAVLTLPLLKRIKQSAPDCRLSVVTRPETKEVFLSCPEVDEVIADDKHSSGGFFKSLFNLAGNLRKRNFDTAILAHRSLRSSLCAFLAGIPLRIGFHSSSGRIFANSIIPFSWLIPDSERNLTLISRLFPAVNLKPADDASAHTYGAVKLPAKETVKERIAKEGISSQKRLIGIHPGSVWPTKRWLPDRYAGLIKRLASDYGAEVILVGGKADVGWNADIRKTAGSDCADWTGTTSLEELMALMGHLNLFITNDSGPMHLAAAFKVPVLAIFGPTTKELGFFPYGEGHKVIEKSLKCRPCGLHGSRKCPRNHFLCMKMISTDEVYKTAVEMLEMKKSPVTSGQGHQSQDNENTTY